MKDFLKDITIEIASSLAAIAACVIVLCVIGLFFVDDVHDVLLILGVAAGVLVISAVYLWYRKISWKDCLDAVWFFTLPW